MSRDELLRLADNPDWCNAKDLSELIDDHGRLIDLLKQVRISAPYELSDGLKVALEACSHIATSKSANQAKRQKSILLQIEGR